ncbi:hypothetical protein K1719_014822 [Acacia pycnantha]|nr:hypothetical protein K1719_014822 [Acacia pycnantha]
MSCATLNIGASSNLHSGISKLFNFRQACFFQKSSAFFFEPFKLSSTTHSIFPATRHFSGSQAFHSTFKCAVGDSEPSVSIGTSTSDSQARLVVLVIGGGGREHALCYALQRSLSVGAVLCAPGNAGISKSGNATCILDLDINDGAAVISFCRKWGVGLVVVGPEAPLVSGIVNKLEKVGIPTFGPSAEAAALEGSKNFMKHLCDKYGIPTAKGDFGSAGCCVIVEEFLEGEEVSFFALVDGEDAIPLESAQDHKRVGDGDIGPNTGGMGAYSPAPILTKELQTIVMDSIIIPSVKGMSAEGCKFVGVLYAGLMIEKKSGLPKLIEYNVRFGDPECQVLMIRLESDLAQVLLTACRGELNGLSLNWSQGSAMVVVMASKGYPGSYEKGTLIQNLEQAENAAPNIKIFHAGTAFDSKGRFIATGGRVLGITAKGNDLEEARDRAYRAVEEINWPEGFYRRDIGWRSLPKKSFATKEVAALEGSKNFVKHLFDKYGIPTAKTHLLQKLYIKEQGAPIVIKVDGLAAGKGVTVAMTLEQAYEAVDSMLVKGDFGSAGCCVIVEEFLEGEEVSFFALVDGEDAIPLESAQDHKRVGDGDTGPNTGGMGAYSPAPILTKELQTIVMDSIIIPSMKGMSAEGCKFVGVLYARLMIEKKSGLPKLIEYNERFGDPECQVLMIRLESDLAQVLLAACRGELNGLSLNWSHGSAMVVVMASKGYPGSYEKGTLIQNLEQAENAAPNIKIFHAGLLLTLKADLSPPWACSRNYCQGNDLEEARDRAYRAVEEINWPEGFYRRDIGWRSLPKKSFATKGNARISKSGNTTCIIDFDINDGASVISFCRKRIVGLVVVGFKPPLVSSIINNLEKVGIAASEQRISSSIYVTNVEFQLPRLVCPILIPNLKKLING